MLRVDGMRAAEERVFKAEHLRDQSVESVGDMGEVFLLGRVEPGEGLCLPSRHGIAPPRAECVIYL